MFELVAPGVCPCSNSMKRARVTPICLPFEEPLVDVLSVNNPIWLYGVVSPDMLDMSGVPNTFVILSVVPTYKCVTPALTG